jgi:HlyD family secretion protein
MSSCIRQCLAIWAVFFLIGTYACTQPSARQSFSASNSPETVAVKRGNFRRTVRLNGSVSATESFSVLAPRLSGQMTGSGMMVITGIVRNGKSVHKDEILVEFDPQAQLKNILDRQAECDGLNQQIRKKQADQASARLSDETDIKGAEVDVQIALVEMRKNDVVPKYQAEINKANLAEAEAQLKLLKETFALKRKAEAADIRILEIQRDRALRALEYAKGNVERMTIRSPMDGLAVLTPTVKGTRTVDPQEGDEVRPGSGIMLVVNPSAMQVSARVNQVDVWEVRAGQAAEIRLEAYPELVFPGKVERISAMSTTSSNSKRIRYFSTAISIQGRNPKLLPDLTAAVDVRLQDRDNVLLLPREAVTIENGQASVTIAVKEKSERRPVKIGPMNDSEVVIESGLDEGALVQRHP